MDRRRYLQALGVGSALSVAGCLGGSDGSSAAIADQTLTVAAATTVNDSGLLGDISAGFKDAFGTTVRAVVRGTGAALRTARDGNCDAVFVHARPLEDEFLRAGHGVNRRTVMGNDFLVVGPPDDPAGTAGSDPLAAFRAIASSRATFLSRGDRSGTHVRERRLWDEAGVEPTGNWYRETGQGMGATLIAAGETGAYTLVDRGTFLNTETDLAAHVARGLDDPPDLLRNEYAVIPTNPARHDVAYALAMAFVGYLTGPGQGRIETFRVDGERAFRPLARSEEPDFNQYVPAEWAP
jgi:tungstate transport system substrate-binding protein